MCKVLKSVRQPCFLPQLFSIHKRTTQNRPSHDQMNLYAGENSSCCAKNSLLGDWPTRRIWTHRVRWDILCLHQVRHDAVLCVGSVVNPCVSNANNQLHWRNLPWRARCKQTLTHHTRNTERAIRAWSPLPCITAWLIPPTGLVSPEQEDLLIPHKRPINNTRLHLRHHRWDFWLSLEQLSTSAMCVCSFSHQGFCTFWQCKCVACASSSKW